MKRFLLAAIAGAAIVLSSPVQAQVYGQFTGAETVPSGGRMFGAYVFSSQNVVGLLAQLRLSFYPNVDFGFTGGLARLDFVGGNRTTIRLGTGLKVKLTDSTESVPVAMALAGDIGIETGDNFHVLTISPAFIASRRFGVGQTAAMTPYVRAGIAISSFDVDDENDTDVSVPLRLGTGFRVAPQLDLAIELQVNLGDNFNDDLGIAAGVNVPF